MYSLNWPNPAAAVLLTVVVVTPVVTGRLLIDVPGVDGIAGNGHRRGAAQVQKVDAVEAGFGLHGATRVGSRHRAEDPRDVRGGGAGGGRGVGGYARPGNRQDRIIQNVTERRKMVRAVGIRASPAAGAS